MRPVICKSRRRVGESRTRRDRPAESRTLGCKRRVGHQEEKYVLRHHCIIHAAKLPCVRIDVIIDFVTSASCTHQHTRRCRSKKCSQCIDTCPIGVFARRFCGITTLPIIIIITHRSGLFCIRTRAARDKSRFATRR